MNNGIFTQNLSTILIFLFALNVSQAQDCDNDRCIDVVQTITPNPTDMNCGISPIFIDGCLTDATPETVITECGADQYPTVWYKVRVDATAAQLQTTVTTSGTWQAVWAIYHGDCDSLVLLSGNSSVQDSIPCSNSDSNAGLHSVKIVKGVTTYWIAVTGIGVTDNPDFSLGIATISDCISCIGDPGCAPEAEWEITNRSSDRALDDPKFCQGEEVTVCVTFDYNASETGVDWFHGLIPDFGPGWDIKAFDPEAIVLSPGGGEWRDISDTSCAPMITEQMHLLCTYTDSLTGRLVLCNTGCQSCPCSGPLLLGSVLPSGWFWSQTGGEGCDNDCRPSTNHGIGSVVVSINFCIDLKVKEFDSNADCIKNRNLRFNFQTTSDGVTGCWNDPVAECKLDYAQIGPNWEIDCSENMYVSAGISGTSVEICSQESTDFEIFIKDGGDDDIHVTFINNPFISGQKNHIFYGGEGTIADILTNNADTTQIAYYIARIKEESIDCTIKTDTFAVFVHPNININIAPYISCSDSIVNAFIEPTVQGGTGNLQFLWSTGEITSSIQVITGISAEYQVTITDEIGCSAEEKAFVQVIKSNESISILFYNIPSCSQSSVNLEIETALIDPSINAVFRLLDCAGNQVMNDTILYVNTNIEGVFVGVNYITNNCFRLETNVSDCISLSDSIVISCISSTVDNTGKSISIIPNPTTGVLTIMNDGKQSISSLKIFNALGLVSTLQYDTSSQVDISHLPNGVYFLNIQFMDGSLSTHRVILVK